ncbi:hypothetical protein LO771_07940 [Streptacidiphilus sp. ASG 303]|uniref:hypothetical protein n=1 Tax=Streptacidiphilus sp. ASG 303 TaxID=2896847 RepID=UPI001E35032A|nr:hypothetical protein [Streptacidiphilus sp. ASG 303]MCD0482344.1 hypothetical protein [Streptacidiphilus sp. ASG 303]
MDITATFTTTPATVMASYRALGRRGYVQRWLVSAGCVAVGLAGVAASLSGARTPPWPGAVLAAWGVVFFALRERAVRRRLAPYLKGTREVTVTLTDTEYRTQGPDRATSRTWTTFRSVSRVGDFWVLRMSPRAGMALPAAALDADQTLAFTAAMREKGLLRSR